MQGTSTPGGSRLPDITHQETYFQLCYTLEQTALDRLRLLATSKSGMHLQNVKTSVPLLLLLLSAE
jgi:hypothetical protein